MTGCAVVVPSHAGCVTGLQTRLGGPAPRYILVMAIDADRDLGVDVLIVGGGMMGNYLARQLAEDYTICLLTDPSVRVETLEAEGYFSAGYDGNDVSRVQPARRAAGYWKLWCESNAVPHDLGDTIAVVPSDALTATTSFWTDASLSFEPLDSVPAIFEDGSIRDATAFSLANDVIVSPSDVVNTLRKGIEDRCAEGEVVKFAMANDSTVEYVEAEINDEMVPVVPRFTVLAASGGNAGLLNKLALRLRDSTRRREAVEMSKGCQAVRRRYVVCIRGDLPLLSGHFGGLVVTAHPTGDPRTNIWLVNPAIDDQSTILGQDDLRFDPPVDPAVVARTVKQMFAMSPELRGRSVRLEWAAYVRRKTEHPMMAAPDTTNVGQPAPAKIENMGLDGFMALWPSHLSYAMIVGELAAERIREALGPRGDFSAGIRVGDLPRSVADLSARWQGPELAWSDWETFAGTHDLEPR